MCRQEDVMTTLSTREPPVAITQQPSAPYRKLAVMVGTFFIIGTLAGVLSVVVGDTVLGEADVLGAAAADETSLIAGALLVLAMGFPLAMVPVLLYPLFRRHNQILAMGAVLFRGVFEAVAYMALAALMFVTAAIGREYAAAGSPTDSHFDLWGAVLPEAMDWVEVLLAMVFSLGAMMLGWLFIRTRIIPRWLALWGFFGAMLYFVAPLIVMFDIQNLDLSLTTSMGWLLAPLAIQEMVFAVWLIVRGFERGPVQQLMR
jgi:hypothetical protein